MSQSRPLLMIPGPVEVSPAVQEAYSVPPPGHRSAPLIESYGNALERLLTVLRAPEDSHPFAFSGSGTVSMEMAVANLAEPGDRVVVVDTGFFGRRMAEMLRRAGAEVDEVGGRVGEVPSLEEVAHILSAGAPAKALFVTHVDTSTGVRVDPAPFAALAREHGALSVFDGVCAAGGEEVDLEAWGADLYLTGSQKALGLPPGLGLMVAGPAAWEARAARRAAPPPLYFDWLSWDPVIQAYRDGQPSYFATPATNLVLALEAGLGEIVSEGVDERMRRHRRAAHAMRAAWSALGLRRIPAGDEVSAHTLSTLHLPDAVELPDLLAAALDHGVILASGLHPDLPRPYFRVGHMGWVTGQPALLQRAVEAVGRSLAELGEPDRTAAAVAALDSALMAPAAG